MANITSGPIVAQHSEQRRDPPCSNPPCSFVGPESFNEWSIASNQSSVTALSCNHQIEATTIMESGSAKEEGFEKCYKSQPTYRQILDEIELIFRLQAVQLQVVSLEATELQSRLQSDDDGSRHTSAYNIVKFLVVIQRLIGQNLMALQHLRATCDLREGAMTTNWIEKRISASHMAPNGRNTLPPKTDDEGANVLTDSFGESNLVAGRDVGDKAALSAPVLVKLWNISSPGSDPFVDKPDSLKSTTAAYSMQLQFHPDIIGLSEHKIFTSTDGSYSQKSQSRRVVLDNLPPDATLMQVAVAVRGFGGIKNMYLLNTSMLLGRHTKSALLEFTNTSAAATYIDAVQWRSLIMESNDGDLYDVAPKLIPTPSYAQTAYEISRLEKGEARTLLFSPFPKKAVWYFLSAIGLKHIVHVGYRQEKVQLKIEFSTLFEARNVAGLVLRGMFNDVSHEHNPRGALQWSPAMEQSAEPGTPQSDKISFISPFALEDKLNRAPFNQYWPTTYKPVMGLHGLRPIQPPPIRPSTAERLAHQYGIDEDQVPHLLEEFEAREETEYRIVGSTITLKRRKWGWSITQEDETKLLMANTLQEPDWASEWDEYFQVRGMINLRTWERYGMIAKHRRETAAKQGIAPWMTPKCEGCEMGCCDIKEAPIPDVVKKYLDFSKYQILDVDEVGSDI